MPARHIYVLSPKKYSPETIAVAFAKTSRSPDSFHKIAAGLNDDQSAQFNERWVIGYGHSSVAEHAVLHIAIENVSRLAMEAIESNRLASYTEKSTRYQKWGTDDFTLPPELSNHPLQETAVRTCRSLFSVYTQSLAPLRALVAKNDPPQKNESGEAYDRRIRSQYVDACRFLLPAASLANLGMTANARVLENAICKMLSHPLAEVRQIGEEMRSVARAEVPTLVKYAAPMTHLVDAGRDFMLPEDPSSIPAQDWCQLIDYDLQGENKVLAAVLYRFGGMSYNQALQTLLNAAAEERIKMAASLLAGLDRHDTPLRELEHTAYTFDLILDQGAYAEFKRHRMMTQTPQALTTRLGYALPRLFMEAGFDQQYCAAMDAVSDAYEELVAWNPYIAAYLVPNGYNRRVLFTMNLRQAFSFCQLRSNPNAHFSIRRVARRIADEIRRIHPLLAAYMQLPQHETWQQIETHYFSRV